MNKAAQPELMTQEEVVDALNKAGFVAHAFAIGDKVREDNYGYVGTVIDIRIDGHVTWYMVSYQLITRDVFGEHLASELSKGE